MPDELFVEPMKEDFSLWRCLHGGPLNRRNIDAPEPADDMGARQSPSFGALGDRALFVHRLMIASPVQAADRYRRKGLATRLARRTGPLGDGARLDFDRGERL